MTDLRVFKPVLGRMFHVESDFFAVKITYVCVQIPNIGKNQPKNNSEKLDFKLFFTFFLFVSQSVYRVMLCNHYLEIITPPVVKKHMFFLGGKFGFLWHIPYRHRYLVYLPPKFPPVVRIHIRSDVNSRAFNSRAKNMVLGHNSLPRKFWRSPLGGNSSYRPPGAF